MRDGALNATLGYCGAKPAESGAPASGRASDKQAITGSGERYPVQRGIVGTKIWIGGVFGSLVKQTRGNYRKRYSEAVIRKSP